jgi:integrase
MPITRNGLPEFCGWNIDRGGRRRRVRFRRNGVSRYLAGMPWSPEFMRAHAAAMQESECALADGSQGAGAKRVMPGTIAALVANYRKLVFPTIEESTRRLRSGLLEPICAQYGDLRVATLKPHHIVQIVMLKAAEGHPFAATNLRKTLRHLLGHAVDLGWIRHNPVAETKPVKTPDTNGIRDWTDGEIEQFRARWPLGTKQRLALELALNTTARRSDMVMLGRQHECPATPAAPHGRIKVAHSKNKSLAIVPILPELKAALAAMTGEPRHLNFLVTERGKPYHLNSLGDEFRKWCHVAGLPKCSIHGLRKSGCRRLAEACVSASDIMAVSGHKTLAMVQKYIEQANSERGAERAIAKLQAARMAE